MIDFITDHLRNGLPIKSVPAKMDIAFIKLLIPFYAKYMIKWKTFDAQSFVSRFSKETRYVYDTFIRIYKSW